MPLMFWSISIAGLLLGLKTKRPFLGLMAGVLLAAILEANLCPKP